jgi:hypothetical protein
MIELTVRELASIVKHLTKVIEVQKQNDEYDNEIELEIPDKLSLDRTANGMPLGHIEYSEDLKEHVFVPVAEKSAAPSWASNIPIPPPFD